MKVFLALSLIAATSASNQQYLMRLQNVKGCTDGWGLHGLWPQWAESCGGPSFSISKVSSIEDQLNDHWPSCEEKNSDLWSHEWSKHGSCSNMTELAYFSKALSLLSEYSDQCKSGAVPLIMAGDNNSNSTDVAIGESCSICFSRSDFTKETCSSGPSPGPSPHPGPSPGPTPDQCEPDKHGPPCDDDADCKKYKYCVRCASSGYCTEVPDDDDVTAKLRK